MSSLARYNYWFVRTWAIFFLAATTVFVPTTVYIHAVRAELSLTTGSTCVRTCTDSHVHAASNNFKYVFRAMSNLDSRMYPSFVFDAVANVLKLLAIRTRCANGVQVWKKI